jgi:hypothetical protein
MDDGRLFTDYRPSCEAIPKARYAGIGQMPGPNIAEGLQANGVSLMSDDRMFTTLVAGTKGRVDTMVPELTKRFCTWEGCETLPAQPVGLGTGRLVVNVEPTADPEKIALKATPALFGIFSSHLTGSHANQRRKEREGNQYSMPYGDY